MYILILRPERKSAINCKLAIIGSEDVFYDYIVFVSIPLLIDICVYISVH